MENEKLYSHYDPLSLSRLENTNISSNTTNEALFHQEIRKNLSRQKFIKGEKIFFKFQ